MTQSFPDRVAELELVLACNFPDGSADRGPAAQFRIMLDDLAASGASYLITGALARGVHERARYTSDVDVILHTGETTLEPSAGKAFRLQAQCERHADWLHVATGRILRIHSAVSGEEANALRDPVRLVLFGFEAQVVSATSLARIHRALGRLDPFVPEKEA